MGDSTLHNASTLDARLRGKDDRTASPRAFVTRNHEGGGDVESPTASPKRLPPASLKRGKGGRRPKKAFCTLVSAESLKERPHARRGDSPNVHHRSSAQLGHAAAQPLRPDPKRASLALWVRPVHTSSMVESTAIDGRRHRDDHLITVDGDAMFVVGADPR